MVADIMMPRMNGLDLCLAVRRDPNLSSVPVVLVSSTIHFLEAADHEMAHSMGASAILARTPNVGDVIAKITRCLDEPVPGPPSLRAEKLGPEYIQRLLRQIELQAGMNASLVKRASLDAAMLGITAAASNVLMRKMDLAAVLDEVLALSLDASGVAAGAIFLIELDGQVRLQSQVGFGESHSGLEQFFGHTELLRLWIDTGNPIEIPGTQGVGPVADEILTRSGSGTVVVAPLVAAGQSLGALVMMTDRQNLGKQWLGAIAALATQLGQAVALSRTLTQLAQSEERLRSLFNGVPIGLFRSKPSGEFLDANPAFLNILRVNQLDDLHRLDARTFYVLQADRTLFLDRLEKHGEVRGFVAQGLRGNAETFWAQLDARVVRDEDGQVQYIEGALSDITDRRRAIEKLSETQTWLQQVVSSSGTIIYVLKRADQRVGATWVSSNIERIMGYTAQEALEPSWWYDHIHPDDAMRTLAEDERLVREGAIRREFRFRNAAGQHRWILDEQRYKRDTNEIVGSWTDITSLKELELQFLQAQKMEAVGRLAGGVAHDFNNLLTAIIGYAELARESLPADAPTQSDIDEITKAATRAASLTRQLLAFSRQQVLNPRVLEFNLILTDLRQMLGRLVGEDIDITASLAQDLGRVRGDQGQLEQVIVNLVVNARDAMPEGGKLTLETANVEIAETRVREGTTVPAGRYVRLCVTDSGIGMNDATRSRIFEPFFTTKEVGKGTGLGLSTVYGIVKQSGGYIWVYSEKGRGTSFRIYLPRVDAPADTVAHPIASDLEQRGNETVLLVEDDEMVRKLASGALARRGYQVIVATSGEDAIRVAEEHPDPIDLLVSDVVMPGMNGPELSRRLASRRPRMKVLYMSGYTDLAVVHHGEIEPGAAFLEKPFTSQLLLTRVREVLDAH